MQRRTLKTSAVMGMLLSMILGTRVYAAPMGGQVKVAQFARQNFSLFVMN
jgi:hypothetical protein